MSIYTNDNVNDSFRKEPDAGKPHVRSSVREVYDRKGCTYSTYESIRGMNIRKPERICGEAVCSFRFLCYRKLLCYANGREI